MVTGVQTKYQLNQSQGQGENEGNGEKKGSNGWSKKELEDACNDTLDQGRVIPGYGHVLHSIDTVLQ